MQAKLLRVIQERSVRRVGGNREIPLDIRIVAATNRDPQEAVKEKLFREDLYFRVAVVTLQIPPLRKRPDDIPALAQFFLKEISDQYGRHIEGFTPQVLDRLCNYEWPGNVRELRNVVERAVSLAQKQLIRDEDLPPDLQRLPRRRAQIDSLDSYETSKAKLLDQFQSDYFSQLMNEENGNITRVAQRAGVDRKTVYRILSSVGMTKNNE